MSELKNQLPKVKDHQNHLMQGLEATRCVHNPAHKANCYTGFVCLAPACVKRLICSKCILEDEDHADKHKKSIINLKKFETMVHDRCIDMFADDIEKNSSEIEYKYGRKLERLAKNCQESISEQLSLNFPISVETLKKRYTEQIGEPVMQINKKVMESISESCMVYLNKTQKFENANIKDSGYHQHQNRALEELVDYIGAKGTAEKELWETTGKILQRQKHSFQYNTELDKKLEDEVREQTDVYIKKVIRTFQKHFYGEEEVSEIQEKSLNMSDTSHDFKFMKEFAKVVEEPKEMVDVSMQCSLLDKVEELRNSIKPTDYIKSSPRRTKTGDYLTNSLKGESNGHGSNIKFNNLRQSEVITNTVITSTFVTDKVITNTGRNEMNLLLPNHDKKKFEIQMERMITDNHLFNNGSIRYFFDEN